MPQMSTHSKYKMIKVSGEKTLMLVAIYKMCYWRVNYKNLVSKYGVKD